MNNNQKWSTKNNLIMQNEPNFQKTKMNVTSIKIKDYENKPNWTLGKNEPNSNPIYAKQTQFQTLPRRFHALKTVNPRTATTCEQLRINLYRLYFIVILFGKGFLYG